MLTWKDDRVQQPPVREDRMVIGVVLPEGYTSGSDFAKDCNVEVLGHCTESLFGQLRSNGANPWDALVTIMNIAEGSTTANSLPNIARIASDAIGRTQSVAATGPMEIPKPEPTDADADDLKEMRAQVWAAGATLEDSEFIARMLWRNGIRFIKVAA